MTILTSWYPKKIKPVHLGMYEVNIDSWPWPILAEWSTAGWSTDINITEWRGIQGPVE